MKENSMQDLTPEEKINQIYLAVIGDEKLGIKGVIQTQKEHSEWIAGQKKMFNKISGGMLVVFAFSSVLAFLINIGLRKLGWI